MSKQPALTRSRGLLLAVVAAVAPVAGAAEPTAPARPVEVRLLAFSHANEIRSLHFHDPVSRTALLSEAAELPRYLGEERHRVELRGDRIVFSAESDPEKALAPGGAAAEVKLPEGVTEAILVFFPAGREARPDYHVTPIDGSARAFPAGSIQTINASPVPIRMMLETQAVALAPGGRKLIEDPPVRANRHTGVVVFAELDGEWRKVASSLWPHPGRKRVFQIIHKDPKSGKVRLEGYRDIAFRAPAG